MKIEPGQMVPLGYGKYFRSDRIVGLEPIEEGRGPGQRTRVYIEQLATPFELYEQPASAFVAGFVGTSNLLEGQVAREVVGSDGQFVVRPEKVSMLAPDEAPSDAGDRCLARGTVREVVYLGAATHSVVDLDAGATLTVAHQNTDRSIDAALERRGQQVVLVWSRDSIVPLGGNDAVPAGSTSGQQPSSLEEKTP